MEQNKQTPARRRRPGKPPSGRKNYASEGDVLTSMPFPADYPATPLKSKNASPAPGSQATHPKSAKHNNRSARPAHVSISPGPARPGRRTPPHSANNKAGSAAFAGANFHASPAPGSLPMPSFFRMRSESATVNGRTKEPSPPASDCDSPSPSQPATVPQVRRYQSPLDALDALFEADRAEKERACRTNSANAAAADGPFSPPSEGRTGRNGSYSFDPIPLKLPHRPAQGGKPGPNSTAASGPRPEPFALPMHEKLRAAGPAENKTSQHVQRQGQGQAQGTPQHLATPPRLDERSEAVKRLLGIGTGTPAASPVSSSTQHQTHYPGVLPFAAASHSSPQLSSGASGVQNGGSVGPEDWKYRGENALRQALKLPFPMGAGLDGNSSPQQQPGPSAGRA
ncbi:hypothetical protein KVR01_008754 [Diaporthe batatas]|uniref:uncharacterized protein n=1 Tax=Diaporthe batatas TaxID=748121 RepID=UPI001D03AD5B|nr:uncharacterized protein KVR01_008754 [Diaporthe batatas]KAG8161767.1 hypothetical protein KVR01_008754 [Diaporthe batatas]